MHQSKYILFIWVGFLILLLCLTVGNCNLLCILGYLKRYLSYLTQHGYVNPKIPICNYKTVQPRILSSQLSSDAPPDKLNKNVKEQSLETGSKAAGPKTTETIKLIKEKLFDKKKDAGILKVEKPVEHVKETPVVKKRKRVDLTASSMERNFITPVRAMSDFLLKPSDLESLPKTKRRSPYEYEPPITVYWRKDVEAKAVQVWGCKENLIKERLFREIEKKKYQQSMSFIKECYIVKKKFYIFLDLFTVKRRLREYRRELSKETDAIETESGLFGRSGKVVITAIVM